MITLYNADALEVLSILDTDSVDCIITSPPYNLRGLRGRRLGGTGHISWNFDLANIEYGDYKDDMPEQGYEDWQVKVLDEMYRIIKPTGSIFYNHKPRMWQRRGYHPMTFIGKSKCQFYQEIIWNRNRTPALDKRILFPFTERIYWLCKKKPNVYKNKVSLKTDLWSLPPEKDNPHPAPFPITIPEQCILLTTQPGDLVMDPFVGSGTTGEACKNKGRNAILIDSSAKAIDIAKERCI